MVAAGCRMVLSCARPAASAVRERGDLYQITENAEVSSAKEGKKMAQRVMRVVEVDASPFHVCFLAADVYV